MSDPKSDSGLYEFAADMGAATDTSKFFKPSSPGAPPVLSYRRLIDDKPKPAEVDLVRDWYLPLGLLGGGVFIECLSALVWQHHDFFRAVVTIGVELTLGTAVMFIAMLIAARLRGIHLGRIGTAALKLAVMAVAPAAASQFISPILNVFPFGGILVWIGQFVLFFALLGALFDLDESDTWYCVFTMFFTQLGLWILAGIVFRS